MTRYDFFLAHASPDKPRVRPLHRALLALGKTCFLDEADLLPGDEWDLEIPRALAEAAVTVVCISPHFTAAWFQRAEIQRAIAQRRSGSGHRVVPVWLEGFQNGGAGTPYGLEVLHGLDAQALGMEEVARRLVGLPAALPSPVDPLVLFAGLCALLNGQWAVLLMEPALRGAQPYLPDRVSAAERAGALMQWASSQGESTVRALEAAMRRLVPGVVGGG